MNVIPSNCTYPQRPRAIAGAVASAAVAGPGATASRLPARRTQALFEAWDRWACQSTPLEQRFEAVRAVRECVRNQAKFLNLSHLGLTDLPSCFPAHIEELDVSTNGLLALPDGLPPFLKGLKTNNNNLRSLPAELPDSIERLSASNNQLMKLPATLPRALRCLDLSHNRIARLPAQLPVNLKVLTIEGNRLASLSDRLPVRLEKINVNYNKLARLPGRLPDGLRILQAKVNRLERLPEKMPSGLRFIHVDQNRIRELPAKLPPALEELRIRFNRLKSVPGSWPPNLRHALFRANKITRIPEEIFSMPHEVYLQFSQNPLTAEARDRVNRRKTEVYYEAERVAALQRLTKALNNAICFWFPAEHHATIREMWSKAAEEPGVEQFVRFLHRLSDAIGMREAEFRLDVADWLLTLPRSPGVLKMTFLIAFDAAETCEDRAALALSHMWAAGFVYRIEEGAYDSYIPTLVEGARKIFRLNSLADTARDKVNQMRKRDLFGGVDEISIYLGYQIKLNGDLQLALPAKQMRFFDPNSVTEEELNRVRIKVMEEENTRFVSWLSCWSPWESLLKRQDRTGYDRMQEEVHEKLDRKFENHLAAALRELGLKNDEDARRLRGPVIMKNIEQGVKICFTRDFLTARNHAHLLHPFWSGVGEFHETLEKSTTIPEIPDR
jgi:Leucine-rich repeat (LRR) protein